MHRLLSLSEMAELLHRTPRQFRKDISARKIPHIQLGRKRLFDPEKVVEHLSPPALKTARARLKAEPGERGRFAEALGL